MSELCGLECALLIVKQPSLVEGTEEYQAVRQAVGKCQMICIDHFIQRSSNYESLSAKTNTLKDTVKKVTWALCCQEDQLRFSQSLEMQKSSLNLLLNALQISRSATQGIKVNASLMQQFSMLPKMQIDVHDGALQQTNKPLDTNRGLLQSAQIGKLTPENDYHKALSTTWTNSLSSAATKSQTTSQPIQWFMSG